MNEHDLHWLVGVLEGEATFGAASPSTPGIPFIRLVMTDQDVVERVDSLWARAVFPVPPRREHYCALPWLAGLLEGEGTFSTTWADGHTYPVVQLKMCDEDVVRRAATMLKAASVTVRPPKYAHWKVTYVAKISGAAAASVMRTVRDRMGVRRREAIDKALKSYRPIQLTVAPAHCIVSGCDEPHRGRGLCHKHYMSWSRDVAKGRAPRITPLR